MPIIIIIIIIISSSSTCNTADDHTQVSVLNCNDYRVIDITRLG